MPYFFSLDQSPSFCAVFGVISCNIDKPISVNHSANIFVFVDNSVHHKDRLTYSGVINKPGELCYLFCPGFYLSLFLMFMVMFFGYISII